MSEDVGRTQTDDPVRAIWNTALTLKVCLRRDINPVQLLCECQSDHTDHTCQLSAWPDCDGPVVVSADGRAHFCQHCVDTTDEEFCGIFVEGCTEIYARDFIGLNLIDAPDQGLDVLATFFPPNLGTIEYGPRRASR